MNTMCYIGHLQQHVGTLLVIYITRLPQVPQPRLDLTLLHQ
jgi:hypothetical protein